MHMGKSVTEAPAAQLTEMDFMSGRWTVALAQQAREHGPLLRWSIPFGPGAGLETYFMIGPEANQLVFHTSRDAFSHDKGWTPVIGDLMGKGLLNMDDPEHARHRKMWNPAFASAYMETYIPLMQQVIARHTAGWAERGEVDLYHESREITFDVAATALAGVENQEDEQRLQQLFYALLYGSGEQARFGDGSYDERMRQAFQARDELTALLTRLIEQRRALPEDQQPHDVLSLILRARDEDGEALSNAQVLGHLNILLVAGHETTTMLGTWVLYLLATLPEQRRRIEEELDALRGEDGALTVEAVRNMRALDNFIKEAGRLHAPVYNVPRGVVQDVEFAGYTLPAGAQVRLALSACHHLPGVFANPERFDPDRFAPPREEDKKTPYSLVTFGGGQRICIGINFANIEVKALVADVLRRYTLSPVSSEAPLQWGFIATMIPNGLPMRVTPTA
jgi:cytochrome P450